MDVELLVARALSAVAVVVAASSKRVLLLGEFARLMVRIRLSGNVGDESRKGVLEFDASRASVGLELMKKWGPKGSLCFKFGLVAICDFAVAYFDRSMLVIRFGSS